MPRLLLIVTGASRGFGACIVQALLEEYVLSSSNDDTYYSYCRIVLCARSTQGLQTTQQHIQELIRKHPLSMDDKPTVDVSLHAMDLADLSHLDDQWDSILASLQNETTSTVRFDRFLFVNNAGSLGHLGPCLESLSLKDMQQTIDLNITSALWLTVKLGKFSQDNRNNNNDNDATMMKTTLINISSLLAIQTFPTMGIYAAGKAARDAFHQTLAQEQTKNDPRIEVLNYAPGPLETNMVTQLRTATQLDAQVQASFAQPVLDPYQSAQVLARLLHAKDTSDSTAYTSGSHVDYYDVCDRYQ